MVNFWKGAGATPLGKLLQCFEHGPHLVAIADNAIPFEPGVKHVVLVIKDPIASVFHPIFDVPLHVPWQFVEYVLGRSEKLCAHFVIPFLKNLRLWMQAMTWKTQYVKARITQSKVLWSMITPG